MANSNPDEFVKKAATTPPPLSLTLVYISDWCSLRPSEYKVSVKCQLTLSFTVSDMISASSIHSRLYFPV